MLSRFVNHFHHAEDPEKDLPRGFFEGNRPDLPQPLRQTLSHLLFIRCSPAFFMI